jgi:hypothetical protein
MAFLVLMLLDVTGVNLEAPIQSSVSVITTASYSAPVVTLTGLFPLLFMVGLVIVSFFDLFHFI